MRNIVYAALRDVRGETDATPSARFKKSFRQWMERRNRKDSTIRTYTTIILQYIDGSINYPVLSSDRLNEYINELESRYAPTTIRKNTAALKAFFRSQNVEFTFNTKELPRVSRKYQPKFTDDELKQMRDCAWTQSSSTFTRFRNRAIIGLSIDKGFLRGELADMNIEDIEWATKKKPHTYIRLHKLKHGKVIKRRLAPQVAQYLLEYVWGFRRYRRKPRIKKTRWRGGTDLITLYGKPKVVHPLWTTSGAGYRLTRSGFQQIFSKIRVKCGINKHRAGFQAARRRLIDSYHEGGVTEAVITAEMGWINPLTVKTYNLPRRKTVKNAIQKADLKRGLYKNEVLVTKKAKKQESIKEPITDQRIPVPLAAPVETQESFTIVEIKSTNAVTSTFQESMVGNDNRVTPVSGPVAVQDDRVLSIRDRVKPLVQVPQRRSPRPTQPIRVPESNPKVSSLPRGTESQDQNGSDPKSSPRNRAVEFKPTLLESKPDKGIDSVENASLTKNVSERDLASQMRQSREPDSPVDDPSWLDATGRVKVPRRKHSRLNNQDNEESVEQAKGQNQWEALRNLTAESKREATPESGKVRIPIRGQASNLQGQATALPEESKREPQHLDPFEALLNMGKRQAPQLSEPPVVVAYELEGISENPESSIGSISKTVTTDSVETRSQPLPRQMRGTTVPDSTKNPNPETINCDDDTFEVFIRALSK
ncbi:site-specific integrase [Candidatus Bathyarchaeota archaeon]|jgi:site-specific recombinase XerD|nr:site-specific integrase [Candidatus Bathyarchaeota archaeon]MBT4424528.1 site-specific integrase [Candidatus Bathyarchaeota archaeon]MBT6605707.1 site-specific integrase [Candidatus Bathyarchaeota archaeon]MBT7187490.1 site-specific integrase [Candidatus Bathyarchaeota archaeon]MBT7346203.1 site-specific integrase [Candidatus Bathyarchaeota archaeon]